MSGYGFSNLHCDVMEFCDEAEPDEDDHTDRQRVVQLLQSYICDIMRRRGLRCRVQVFGSFACGLCIKASDVDLVITGLAEPNHETGEYDEWTKMRAVGTLDQIGDMLREWKKLGYPEVSVIANSRMPLLKVELDYGLNVDISIGDDTGPRAAEYMAEMMDDYPAMRPMVLVLKTLIRNAGLHEVRYGGLSSYSLCCMVIAHLQEEEKAGRSTDDVGVMLEAFLQRFGYDFNYDYDAVCTLSGGITSKRRVKFSLEVHCPITCRDVGKGTFKVARVRKCFRAAVDRLGAVRYTYGITQLQALLDVDDNFGLSPRR